MVACTAGCTSPDTPPDPPSLSTNDTATERCSPTELQFHLVGGPEYSGVIIPQEYFAKSLDDEAAFAKWFGVKVQSAWTPTDVDVEVAENGIRGMLTTFTGNTDDASKIMRNLPNYRRQYAGLVVNGHRQVVCRFFMPETTFFRRWQCEYARGNDFGVLLWETRYDVVAHRYEGLRIGS
jgi:hypothetical protein